MVLEHSSLLMNKFLLSMHNSRFLPIFSTKFICIHAVRFHKLFSQSRPFFELVKSLSQHIKPSAKSSSINPPKKTRLFTQHTCRKVRCPYPTLKPADLPRGRTNPPSRNHVATRMRLPSVLPRVPSYRLVSLGSCNYSHNLLVK